MNLNLDLKHFNVKHLSAGLISGFLAITGASLLILEAAANGNYTYAETMSWFFFVHLISGTFSIVMPYFFKTPFTGGHSLAGITYLVTVTPLVSFNELIAGFLLSGFIVFLLGVSGWFHKIFKYLPFEVISAMLAGMVFHTLISLAAQFKDAIIIVIFAVGAFFITRKFSKNFPAIFSALIISFVILFITDAFPSIESSMYTISLDLYTPSFSIGSVLSVGIPLCILVLSNDIIVGVSELKKHGYELKKMSIITLSGIFSMVGSFFGSHCSNLAGIMTSICSNPSLGKKQYRYIASIISGFVLVTFALFSSYLIPFILALPKGFPAVIAFLTLYGIFISSVKTSVSNKSLYPAILPTLIISASNLQIGIFNGPLIGLITGLIITSIIKLVRRKSNVVSQ